MQLAERGHLVCYVTCRTGWQWCGVVKLFNYLNPKCAFWAWRDDLEGGENTGTSDKAPEAAPFEKYKTQNIDGIQIESNTKYNSDEYIVMKGKLWHYAFSTISFLGKKNKKKQQHTLPE